jgi:BirA family biotin operon repressor/biotin-[acetyl-CoA-carboxylase] ligase
MSTRTELLKLLNDNQGEFLSGQQLGQQLDVSRNAIWKAVTQLKKDGYEIESKTNLGYRLVDGKNLLTFDSVSAGITVPCKLKVLDTVTSTNDLAKAETLGATPLAIIANRQSGGRGRLGRTFESPGGTGLYLTIGLTPDFAIDKALYVTMASAVATCRAIEKVCGVNPKIKWVNDIFYRHKKVCGILTEAQTNFETGKIDSLIIGIGVNCFPGSFPEEIKNIAGPISDDPGSFSRSDLAAEIINETMAVLEDMEEKHFFIDYRSKCFILGKKIKVHPNYDDKGTLAYAVDIDDDGGLVVKYLQGPKNGEIETLHTGEISISI